MEQVREWFAGSLAERAMEGLRRRGFEAVFARDREEARRHIVEMVPPGATVGFAGVAGTISLRELGILEALRERGCRLLISTDDSTPPDLLLQQRREALLAEVFISSTNALTADGVLVNVDALGNRVAAMIFGPKRVIVVAGVNKIVRTVDEALARVKHVAAVLNARRLNRQTPCASTGICTDCDSPERICRVTTIMERRPSRTEVCVVVVGESLGF